MTPADKLDFDQAPPGRARANAAATAQMVAGSADRQGAPHLDQPAPCRVGLMPGADKPGWLDWMARIVAWGTITMPRVAPSRWWQESNRRRANDLRSDPFEVIADGGVKLEAVHFPAREASAITTADSHSGDATASSNTPNITSPRPTIFFSHGWTETKEFHIRLVRVLTAAGYPVVLYDQRGHGRSGGSCTLGVAEPGDLRAVIDEASRRGWTRGEARSIITMGVSLGGATVLRHAATDPRVAGVIAFTPFKRFVDAIRSYGRRYFPPANRDWLVRGFVQCCKSRGYDITEAAPIAAIARLDVPVLLVIGERDRNLPEWEHTKELLAAAKPGLARLITVKEATHFNICMRKWPGLDEEMLAFLERAIEPLSRRERTASSAAEGASG